MNFPVPVSPQRIGALLIGEEDDEIQPPFRILRMRRHNALDTIVTLTAARSETVCRIGYNRLVPKPRHQLASQRVQAGLATIRRIPMNDATLHRFIKRGN